MLLLLASVMLIAAYWTTLSIVRDVEYVEGEMALPQPVTLGTVSIEETLQRRSSIREYNDQPLSLEELSQLLWAAQGVTRPEWGGRTAPSAGGTYPLEVYIVVSDMGVNDLAPGIYHYIPGRHALLLVEPGDKSSELAVAALDQEWVADAKINIVIAAVFERTTERYGERGNRYVYMEAGHADQNIYLQAAALDLGTVVIGAFHDDQVHRLLGLSGEQKPLYIASVGHPL